MNRKFTIVLEVKDEVYEDESNEEAAQAMKEYIADAAVDSFCYEVTKIEVTCA